MKPRFALLGALLILAAACTDDKRNRQSNAFTTSPKAPLLTMRNVPTNASTICIANVRKRDEVLAKNPAANHAALDAAIEDVCQ
jgi:hypothetical protein